ncbi:pyruvate, phosphate dikinase 2-like [Panicum miliaceum]|uniref:Pyruvate, phosphate dikinase 2-like n=1 Tax=Panicum miliaceum TaxID=4540 RepID=A0A3L6TTS5_PANMI|nr:pyruvate, phosphate dikinase 2-like [Panicum miliaceum]
MPPGLWDEVLDALRCVERDMGATLGDPRRPLLLSVRSGVAVSMPGMMDTVLNLGLNDDVVAGLADRSGRRFAFDSYRRFLDMFGNVALAVAEACGAGMRLVAAPSRRQQATPALVTSVLTPVLPTSMDADFQRGVDGHGDAAPWSEP